MYVDGSKCSESKIKVGVGVEIRRDGSAVIGQEQDKIGGGFDSKQAWHGELSDLQLWSEPLCSTQIYRLFRRDSNQVGSVISWMQSSIVANGVVFSGSNECNDLKEV
ncbi:C-reactive protein 1.4-like [Limulus polyphemus]|uniref:C-reactive protein 1.4-like n=1 Tax=Limulus polyphemus TaxID=6850 RepID=A0ABM1BQQ6_LIMPO|nr:C-reactive protein 1.4-like [Limulus polyphemus]